jgi:hypothetical protein
MWSNFSPNLQVQTEEWNSTLDTFEQATNNEPDRITAHALGVLLGEPREEQCEH